jgi:hypothetical protein
MPPRSNLTGKIYGDLTVLEFFGSNKHKMAQFVVECKCGKTKIVLGQNLKTGATKSCGHHYVTYRGERMTIADALRKNGTTVPVRTVKARIHRNWPVEEALETPSRSHRRHYHGSRTYRPNKHGFAGVVKSKRKNGFEAKICGRYLGYFSTPEAAGAAYQSAREQLYRQENVIYK